MVPRGKLQTIENFSKVKNESDSGEKLSIPRAIRVFSYPLGFYFQLISHRVLFYFVSSMNKNGEENTNKS